MYMYNTTYVYCYIDSICIRTHRARRSAIFQREDETISGVGIVRNRSSRADARDWSRGFRFDDMASREEGTTERHPIRID